MIVQESSDLAIAAVRYSDLDRERASRRNQECFVLPSPATLSSWRADAEQVLGYYVYNSRQNDVNYFFDNYSTPDWRVVELVPMASKSGIIADVVLDLLVALHRLRGNKNRHLVHYDRALSNFGKVLQRPHIEKQNWLSLLSCILLLAQYDVNTKSGKDLAMHLRAAANLLLLNADTEVPQAQEYKKRTLTRITMIYDVQHNLVTGDPLHLPLSSYAMMCVTAIPHTVLGRVSLDELWSQTHYLWARFASLTCSMEMSDMEATKLSQALLLVLDNCKKHYTVVDHRSPLHAASPFGKTIIYKSPALRLVGVNLHTLVLLLCSWSANGRIYFDKIVSRNHICAAHSPLFVWGPRGEGTKDPGKFVHHAFPSILHLMLAASEIGPAERAQQSWIRGLMAKASDHGYTLGETLLQILQSRTAEPSRNWDDIGCRAFVTTCRYLRKSGLA